MATWLWLLIWRVTQLSKAIKVEVNADKERIFLNWGQIKSLVQDVQSIKQQILPAWQKHWSRKLTTEKLTSDKGLDTSLVLATSAIAAVRCFSNSSFSSVLLTTVWVCRVFLWSSSRLSTSSFLAHFYRESENKAAEIITRVRSLKYRN